MSGEATISTYSSLQAPNGCRGLFNGTKGWAYIGPSDTIDTKAFPGTLPLAYIKERYGVSQNVSEAAEGVKRGEPSRRPGRRLIRKINPCLDTVDLEHLVHEAERAPAVPSTAELNLCRGEGKEGGGGMSRAGQPIVLTLHAILAAKTNIPEKILAAAAAASPSVRVGEGRDQCFSPSATAKETGEHRAGADGDLKVTDLAQFPPLMLRSPTAEKSGLYLSSPVTMIKRPPAAPRGRKEGGGDDVSSDPVVSCSEALEATLVAEAAQAVGGRVEARAEAVARVGWWLRWATRGAGSREDPTVTAAVAEGGRDEDDNWSEDGSAVGDEGWHVVGSSREMVPVAKTTERAESTSEMDVCCSLEDVLMATPTTPGGGTWALVDSGEQEVTRDLSSCCWGNASGAGGVTVGGGGCGDKDAAETGHGVFGEAGKVADEAYEMLCLEDGVSPAGEPHVGPEGSIVVRPGAKVAIEDALRSAANTNVWDATATTLSNEHEDQGEDISFAVETEGEMGISPAISHSPPTPLPYPPAEHPPKVMDKPRSFRDTLMASSPSGTTEFLESSPMGRRGRGTGSQFPSGPTLVNGGGKGGVVFMWKEAAAGRGSKGGNTESFDVEDPYYARKRVGAFAHRTKPRGRDHK